MNAPADYMNPVEGEEGGSQTKNTSTAGEGEGKNTYLDYSGLGAGAGAAAAAGGTAAGATAATGTSNPTSTTNESSNQTSSSAPQQETRQGTSSTRYAQQDMTHAAGQLASGTPETKTDSQGEKQGIMEPGTVGQAPKKHPMRDELGEEMKGQGGGGGSAGDNNRGSGSGGSGVIDQASNYANSAVQSAKSGAGAVMGAVGLGGGGGGKQGEEEEEKRRQEEAEREKERRRDDPEVERMDGRNVEEFLRSKTASAAEPMKR